MSAISGKHFFAKGRTRLLGAFLLALVCGGGFVMISRFNVTRLGFDPIRAIQSVPWDKAVPFVPGWVWVYLLYYPFCFLPLFLREVREDAEIFTKTVGAFGLQFGVSFAIFLLWPLRMVHPALPSGVNGHILEHLYAFDLGFNSFPSLHLANIVFVSILFLRLRGKYWAIGVLGVAAMIAASTMLIKQHFISDVLTGALLGWASFVFAEYFWGSGTLKRFSVDNEAVANIAG